MPSNLYGYNDNYHPDNAHVLPALIRRFHEAKVSGLEEVVVWGSGTPLREFLFADDLAEACIFLMQQYDAATPINVGSGEEISIRELAELIKSVTGYTGRLVFDPSKPDGTPRKLMDVRKIHALGWHHSTTLPDGIQLAYEDFLRRFGNQ